MQKLTFGMIDMHKMVDFLIGTHNFPSLENLLNNNMGYQKMIKF